ncbi:hypothetical protein LX36DRAFT_660897 [Colletotrichum falcatum]|nr:hypothetical protein LX36DRAFT_660897 [Colletotrichum falcatum]
MPEVVAVVHSLLLRSTRINADIDTADRLAPTESFHLGRQTVCRCLFGKRRTSQQRTSIDSSSRPHSVRVQQRTSPVIMQSGKRKAVPCYGRSR